MAKVWADWWTCSYWLMVSRREEAHFTSDGSMEGITLSCGEVVMPLVGNTLGKLHKSHPSTKKQFL